MLHLSAVLFIGVSVNLRLYLLFAQSALSTRAAQLLCCLCPLFFVSASLLINAFSYCALSRRSALGLRSSYVATPSVLFIGLR